MTEFMKNAEKLDRLAADYTTICAALRAGNDELKEISSSIENRIARERDQQTERITELKKIVSDVNGRSATIRHMAQLELDQLEVLEITITPQERQAFQDRISEIKTSHKDLLQTKTRLLEAHEVMRRQLESMRPGKLHSVDTDTFLSWIESGEKRFNERFGDAK